MYLLRRRLRHLNAISIYNVSLTKNANLSLEHEHTPCLFLVVEDIKGRCLYVSEAQKGSQCGCLQFDEIPSLLYTMTRIKIKIIGQIPRTMLLEKTEEFPVWTTLAIYAIDLSRLSPVLSDDEGNLFPKTENVNVPLLHFSDGLFSAPGNFEASPKNFLEPVSQKKSFTYNGVLKLNKILEYWTQMQLEIQELSEKIDELVDNSPKPVSKDAILHACESLTLSIERRQSKVQSLESSNKYGSSCHLSSTTELPINDDYAATLSNYTSVFHRLQSLEERKIGQLLIAMKGTGLCGQNGYVIPNSEDQSIYEMRLKRVDLFTALDDRDRILKNSTLGYYLLFVNILADRVFHMPLPHRLSFYGSTSVIDNALPLYLAASSTQQHLIDFELAIERFNLNIMQVNQFLECHR
ncbi:LAFA_0D13894g1_1 [Lachancea sp. 'fantastica']|nr:LAFA_0D13894g1_1 [Lachancea sp. 'fantastica']